MAFVSDKQRAFVMAKLKGLATPQGVAGLAAGAGGALLAYKGKGKLMRGLGAAAAAGGAALAFGVGHKVYDHAKQAAANTHEAHKVMVEGAKNIAGQALEKTRMMPVEKITAWGIDAGAAFGESVLKGRLDEHYKRIGHNLGSLIGRASAASSAAVGEHMRTFHGKVFRLTPDEMKAARSRGIADLEEKFGPLMKPRELRNKAEVIKMHNAVNMMMQDMMKGGSFDWSPTAENLTHYLKKVNARDADSPEKRRHLWSLFNVKRVTGIDSLYGG